MTEENTRNSEILVIPTSLNLGHLQALAYRPPANTYFFIYSKKRMQVIRPEKRQAKSELLQRYFPFVKNS